MLGGAGPAGDQEGQAQSPSASEQLGELQAQLKALRESASTLAAATGVISSGAGGQGRSASQVGSVSSCCLPGPFGAVSGAVGSRGQMEPTPTACKLGPPGTAGKSKGGGF